MSCSTCDASPAANGTRAVVITISDSCSRGEKPDLSGPAVAGALEQRGFQIIERTVVADDRAAIQNKLIEFCGRARLVVTTGGTGIAPRDVTPEATSAVCDRLVEGIAEQIKDATTVALMAERWSDQGWPARVDDTGVALTADFSAPSAGPPPWAIFRMVPDRATALQTVEPGGATQWRFMAT